ncbi:hypothetical protein [Providencia rettgeri]|uniref:hypothetical protein n=1 Tax=Providencia rettgeri TaxID=587 RepID=UPI001182C790|nr:hypothetical protein [Providencia rettgeri]
MRITTTVKNKDDVELIAYSHWCLSTFISMQHKDCAYGRNDMQVWIVRKKNGNISVKGYRN